VSLHRSKKKQNEKTTRADPDDGVIGRESVHIWRVPALAEFVCCCTQHSINITCLSVSYIHQILTSTSYSNHSQYLSSLTAALLLYTFNGLFSRITWASRYQKGKTSLILNEARDDGVLGWQRHQLDHMQTICTSLQTDNHINTSSINFYTPDALPEAQPTVSKH